MVKIVKRHRTQEVDNIMSLKIQTRTISMTEAVFEGWELEVEDEGVFRGETLEDLKRYLLSISYVVHGADVSEPWAEFVVAGTPCVVCHIYAYDAAVIFHWLRNVYNSELSVFTNTWAHPITADIPVNNTIFRLHDVERLVGKSAEEWANDENLTGNVIIEGMKKYREKYGSLYNIPITQAGELRRKCKKAIKSKKWMAQTTETIKSYSYKTYRDLVLAFAGGTMGVNEYYKRMKIRNVHSFDMSSAYPGVMVSRKFPVTPWEPCGYDRDENYRYYLVVKFVNVRAKTINKFFPFAKCKDGRGQRDEGLGLKSADEVTLTVTDVDFEIFNKTYRYESLEILECYRSRAEYLPAELIRIILEDYGKKTNLKGTGRVSEYRKAKVDCNLHYGVAVTKTITDEITFHKGEWHRDEILDEKDFNHRRDKSLKSKPFLSYQIGVWVTAYVRDIMWEIIQKLDRYVVYYDTDCIKCVKFSDEFEKANEKIRERIRKAAEVLKIPEADFSPKGRTIGCFEREDFALEFKALDIKRYAYRTESGIVAKITGMPNDHINLQDVDDLKPYMQWSADESGRYLIIYNRNGNNFSVSKLPAEFTMGDYPEFEAFRLIMGWYKDATGTNIFRGL